MVTIALRPRVLLLLVGIGCSDGPSSPSSSLRLCWRQSQSGVSQTRPVGFEDIVVFATGTGEVVARDFTTGRPRWTTRVDTARVSGMSLAVVNGIVVVPVYDFTVGLDVRSGAQRWRYQSPADSLINPARATPGYVGRTRIDVDGTTAYVPAWGATVSAVDVVSGAARWVWRFRDTTRFRAGAMGARVSGDTVYATVWHYLDALGGRSEPILVAIDKNSGTELWQYRVPSYTFGVTVEGSPVIRDRLVIFSTIGGYEFAVDRFTGREIWRFTPTPTHATFAQSEIRGDTIFHDGGDGNVYALRASDGSLLWRSSYGGQTKFDFLVTLKGVYIAADGELTVLDVATGKKRAFVAHDQNGGAVSPPASHNNRVFVNAVGAALCYVE